MNPKEEILFRSFYFKPYTYGDIDCIQKKALFTRNNDNIRRSYSTQKPNKRSQFISLWSEYIPRVVWPTKVYELEGLIAECPKPPPSID